MTEEERYEKLNDKLDRILEKIDGKIDNMDKKIQNHEQRIIILEVHDKGEMKTDWRTQLLLLLAKCLVVGSVVVASLTGVSGIISKIFGF